MDDKLENLIKGFFYALKDILKEELKEELANEIKFLTKNNNLQTKVFYSLEEVAFLTGLSVGALKGRKRRKTLEFVYDGNTPLIPADEYLRLVEKLNNQTKLKKAS